MLLSNTSINRPVFTVMVMLALIVFGYVSFTRLGIDLMPDVEFPWLTITVVYPGADPETVESEVVNRIEDEAATLSGIKNIESRSVENIGLVFIEYELDVDIDIAAQDVRARLDTIRRDLPTNAEPPIVEKLDIMGESILSIAVSADMPLADLTKFVKDRIKAKIESVSGVGSVKLIGGREREIHVDLDVEQMRSRGVSVEEIIGALQMSNIEIPGGRIQTGTRELIVKTKGRVFAADEFGKLVIRSGRDGIIRLEDIADVKDTLEEKRSLARLNGKDAISLEVMKKSKANTVQVAENVKKELEKLKRELPPSISIEIPVDRSIFIKASFQDLFKTLFYAGLCVLFVILFFLRSLRSTLIVGASIPTSIIATFSFIDALGFTLNIITMLGLSLSIGMLVDDAIVVLENIYRHMESGENKVDAARNAAAEIGFAVMTSTFSIVAVFVPIAFAYGIVGRFLYQFGMTVSFTILVSLFVSLTLIPMLSSKFLAVTHAYGRVGLAIERGLKGLDSAYRILLKSALRHKFVTVLVAFLVFIFSMWLASIIPNEFEPKMDQEVFGVAVETPPGSTIEQIEAKIAEVENIAKDIPGVDALFSVVGGGMVESITNGGVYVSLVPREKRKMSQVDLMALTRQKLSNITGAKISVVDARSLSGGLPGDIQVAFYGKDINQLIKTSETLMERWAKEPGFVDIDMSFEAGKPEVRVIIDRERAANLKLNVMGIASTINGLISGENVITTFKEGGDDYDVKVRLKKQYRDDTSDLLSLPIRGMSDDGLIDLGAIAQIQTGAGPSEIHHKDKQRTVTVSANLEGLPLGLAKERSIKIIEEFLPAGVTYAFEGYAEIMEESFSSLFFSLFLAIIIIYMVLASQFENLIHPFSVMLSLPLSLIGAFGALFLSGMTINIMTLIGTIMLMGIVTKNAILLVDYTNTLRHRGLSRDEALSEAGPVRLRPILMTTSTTILGMVPVAIARGAGSEIQAPMAVCVIGGLLTSTLLTLVVVPVVYSILDSWLAAITRLFVRNPKK